MILLDSSFIHNWQGTVVVESTFTTDITRSALDVAEERIGLLDRPMRAVTYKFTGLSQQESTRLLTVLAKYSDVELSIPLFSDKVKLDSDSSGTTINVDYTNRRFFTGSKIAIYQIDKNGKIVSIEELTISSLFTSPNRIETVETLSKTYLSRDSFVAPLLSVDINLEGQGTLLSDYNADLILTLTEKLSSALPVIESGDPTGFPLYNGFPVFTVNPDWKGNLSSGVIRAGRAYPSGRSKVVFTTGSRPQWRHDFSFSLLSRNQAWKVIRFFESRKGRLHPFWVVAPFTLFEATNISATFIDVTPFGSITDIDKFFESIAIVLKQGDPIVRNITSIVDNTTFWRITFDSSIPATNLSDIKRVTSAHFVRFLGDNLLENWVSDENCIIVFSAIDILQEVNAPLGTNPYFPIGPYFSRQAIQVLGGVPFGVFFTRQTVQVLQTIPVPIETRNTRQVLQVLSQLEPPPPSTQQTRNTRQVLQVLAKVT